MFRLRQLVYEIALLSALAAATFAWAHQPVSALITLAVVAALMGLALKKRWLYNGSMPTIPTVPQNGVHSVEWNIVVHRGNDKRWEYHANTVEEHGRFARIGVFDRDFITRSGARRAAKRRIRHNEKIIRRLRKTAGAARLYTYKIPAA